MFFFSRNDFTSRVTSPVMCPLQRIGIWHGIWRFEAEIRTIIIIIMSLSRDFVCKQLNIHVEFS